MLFKKEKKEVSSEEEKKPTYWERVVLGKGTVAEDWPTAEQLWKDKGVQKAIENHKELKELMGKNKDS